MNLDAQQQSLLVWYTEMAKNPAWKAYAWGQVKALAANWPQFYGDLPARLTQAMTEGKA